MKSDAADYSIDDLKRDRKAAWTGVRNYQARNNLKAMGKGDLVLFYHSVVGKEIKGVAEVTREYYPDPTTQDEAWVVVDLKPVTPFNLPVTLEQIKNHPKLENISLVKQSRLSVMPITKSEFKIILTLGKTKCKGV